MSITGADAGAGGPAAPSFTDLNHLLRTRAERTPDRVAYSVLHNGERPDAELTYGGLDRGARAVAARLLRHGAPGDRVLLFPGGTAFLTGFFGCLYAGMVAVCVDLPRPGRPLSRLLPILREAGPLLALAPAGTAGDRPDLVAALAGGGCLWLPEGEPPVPPLAPSAVPFPGPDRLAWLQYTSGSLSDPKGVMVSHGNALATLLDLDRAWRHGPDCHMVTWLPVFHDMGLVYGVLQPLYNGFPCTMMTPGAFLQQPIRWLRAIARTRATHSAAPNFAFQLCVDTARPDRLADLDLRSLKVVLNGAEPLRDAVLRRFAETFAPCGFDPDALCPGYGLAEATLKVATKPRGAPLRRLAVDPRALESNRVKERAEPDGGRILVGHGHSDNGARIEIVDPATFRRCRAGEVGEIWVTGPSVALGYWRRPQETDAVFRAFLADGDRDGGGGPAGPFLRTGDLGFIDRGDLFITGRLKDVIVIHGRNHYPQDIELTVQSCHPALRPDHGAAFAVETEDGERLVVVQEVRRSHLRDLDPGEVVGCIRQAVAEMHDLGASAVVLVGPGTIARTTSGKIQRARCRAGHLAGTLAIIHSTDRSPSPSQATPAAPAAPGREPPANSEKSHAVSVAD